jgi:hypothetical protein
MPTVDDVVGTAVTAEPFYLTVDPYLQSFADVSDMINDHELNMYSSDMHSGWRGSTLEMRFAPDDPSQPGTGELLGVFRMSATQKTNYYYDYYSGGETSKRGDGSLCTTGLTH